ncbi:MAG: hypothetical protein AAGD11_08040 [Planctomycetota bacterium]
MIKSPPTKVTRSPIFYASMAIFFVSFSIESSAAEHDVKKVQGVRARLYWIGSRVDPEKSLAPNQSPNVDVEIASFSVKGNEAWFGKAKGAYTQQYVLVLESTVHLEEAMEMEFRLESEAPAVLLISGQEIAFSEEGDFDIEDYEAEANQIQLKIVQYLNRQTRNLDLQWRTGDQDRFEPLPEDRLLTEDFYFRPTNSTAKRQVEVDDRPGRREKVDGLFPGLDVWTIRPPGVEVPVGGLDTLSDGQLVVATFDARRLRAPVPQLEPDGELWLYMNPNVTSREDIVRQRIADNLYEPSGVCVVGDSIYVSQRDEVTRFDYDASGDRWTTSTVATGWESNDFHALSFGLIYQTGVDRHPGYLLMARGTGLGLRRNPANHGSVWKIDLAKSAGKSVTAITGGHRTPNGIGFGPDDHVFVTDNQGEFTPANELNHVVAGAFYGFEHTTEEGGALSPFQHRETTEAAVLLPQDEIANSPSQPLLIPEGWPYAGQMLVGDVKYGGINRVFLESVKGRWQGAAFRFTQGLEAGVNRMTFADDGNLFVGGIGGNHSSTWNWVNHRGRKTYQGLQRLQPNGAAVFDLACVSATHDGFRISFTQPVRASWLVDVANYQLRQWRYEATPDYGGPKIGISDLHVVDAEPADDGLSVELRVVGRKTGHVIHFMVDPTAEDGSKLWSTEAWYTLWNIP